MRALEEVKALLLPVLDFFARFWVQTSSFCLVRLAQKLTQRLHQAQNSKLIAKEEKEV